MCEIEPRLPWDALLGVLEARNDHGEQDWASPPRRRLRGIQAAAVNQATASPWGVGACVCTPSVGRRGRAKIQDVWTPEMQCDSESPPHASRQHVGMQTFFPAGRPEVLLSFGGDRVEHAVPGQRNREDGRNHASWETSPIQSRGTGAAFRSPAGEALPLTPREVAVSLSRPSPVLAWQPEMQIKFDSDDSEDGGANCVVMVMKPVSTPDDRPRFPLQAATYHEAGSRDRQNPTADWKKFREYIYFLIVK